MRAGAGEFLEGVREEPSANRHAAELRQYTGAAATSAHHLIEMPTPTIPFDLVEAKLSRPSARPGTLAKPDAIERLCASMSPFAAIVAPAGYGKTTLLAKWAEADPRPFAWVALDDRDDDPLAAGPHGVARRALDEGQLAVRGSRKHSLTLWP